MNRLILLLALCAPGSRAVGQQLDSPRELRNDPQKLSVVLPALAQHVLAVYKDEDRERYLDTLFRLQAVAGHYDDADRSLTTLRELRQAAGGAQPDVSSLRWVIYLRAKSRQVSEQLIFEEAFKQSFREVVGALDEKTAAKQVSWTLGAPAIALENDLQDALERSSDTNALALSEAIDLLRKYFAVGAYGEFRPLLAELQDEDDYRRYIIEKDIGVKTADGATICTLVVRQRNVTARIPALLNFTIYADPGSTMAEARLTASNGYAGVEGLTRGKGCSPDKPVPIEHDGPDADAVITWISKQEWSDGRVGMYGGSYEGFTQWAAAKHLPAALKAIMPSVTFAPGIDFPMPGGIFQTYGYPWPFYTTNNKTLDDRAYFDSKHWDSLNRKFYVSGRAYRELDKLDATPNPIWDRWLEHPTYDAYWQSAIPYKQEFGEINIPVLTTTGYYDGGQIGAIYYFEEHYKYLPNANHYFVIGPYDHISGQHGTRGQKTLRGYSLDPIAQIDIAELRYQWFDYLFKGSRKPDLLKDKVNFEVMGANVWKHAPSLAAMSNKKLRFHLGAISSGQTYRFVEKTDSDKFISQQVNFKDRTDADRVAQPTSGVDSWNDDEFIVSDKLKFFNGLEFMSDPFKTPVEVSGFFSGRLDFLTNKKDFDFNIQFYEQLPSGRYIQLSFYAARASHVRNLSRRHLLVPQKRQQFEFRCNVVTSRLLQTGSRLVIVLKVIKRPDEQINYGTGKDVSDETIADAKSPLRIKWFSSSFVDVPFRSPDY
jgi:putative CocE/NonD family hydrolase